MEAKILRMKVKSETTTIKVKRTTKKKLNSLKNYLDSESFDKVLDGMIKLVNEYKLKKEMKDKYFTTKKWLERFKYFNVLVILIKV